MVGMFGCEEVKAQGTGKCGSCGKVKPIHKTWNKAVGVERGSSRYAVKALHWCKECWVENIELQKNSLLRTLNDNIEMYIGISKDNNLPVNEEVIAEMKQKTMDRIAKECAL